MGRIDSERLKHPSAFPPMRLWTSSQALFHGLPSTALVSAPITHKTCFAGPGEALSALDADRTLN